MLRTTADHAVKHRKKKTRPVSSSPLQQMDETRTQVTLPRADSVQRSKRSSSSSLYDSRNKKRKKKGSADTLDTFEAEVKKASSVRGSRIDGAQREATGAIRTSEDEIREEVFGVEEEKERLKERLMFRMLDGLMIEGDPKKYVFVANMYQCVVILAILASVVNFLVGTDPAFWGKVSDSRDGIEVAIVVIFTIDYILRLCSTRQPRFWLPYSWRCSCFKRVPIVLWCIGPIDDIKDEAEMGDLDFASRKRGFVWKYMNIVDFMSIAPYYVELVTRSVSNDITSVFTVLRILRLFRLFRIFKAAKYSTLLKVVGTTIKRSGRGFALLFLSTGMASLLFGAVVFYAENMSYCEFIASEDGGVWVYSDALPDIEPSYFQSVMDGVWWSVVTLTTVGYGDLYPRSPLGRIVASITVLSGLVVLAFPITVIGANFIEIANIAEKKNVDEYVFDLDMAHGPTKHMSNADMLKVMRKELNFQATAINDLQSVLDKVGMRWRMLEAAHAVIQRNAREQYLEADLRPSLHVGRRSESRERKRTLSDSG